MATLIFRLFYVPFRFFYIFFVCLGSGVYYLVLGRKKSNLGVFYQKVFDRLGGTFIKVGQALSLRLDFLPPEHCEALSTLLDSVKPFSSEMAKKILEKELNGKAETFFKSFPKKPFASASFSQVYKVHDHKGHLLAVKIMRPNMHNIVFADTFFMKCASIFLGVFGIGTRLGVNRVIKEVIAVLNQELDYKRETEMINLFRTETEDISFLVIPKVYKNLCTPSIITMDFLEGTSLREVLTKVRANPGVDIEGSDGTRIDLPQTAKSIYEITMRCVFEKNFFHADPHPGNILLLKGGKIGLIDFGICGSLSQEMKMDNFRYLDALSSGNVEYAAELFTEMVTPNSGADYEGLKRDMTYRLAVWRASTSNPNASFKDKSSGILVNDTMGLAGKYSFFLSSNIVLYYKALLTIDHVSIELNPHYDSLDEARNYVRDSTKRRIEKLLGPKSLERIINTSIRKFLEIAENTDSFLEKFKDWLDSKIDKSYQRTKNRPLIYLASGVLIVSAMVLVGLKIAWPCSFLPALSIKGCMGIGAGLIFVGYRITK